MGDRSKYEKNPEVFIEHSQRLSKSKLWELQTAAYTQFGPRAWGEKGVPFYITSNPFIARQYAQLVLGYIRDCLGPQAKTPMDLSAPIYILDLGAGTGRFGFLFIKHFVELLAGFPHLPIKFRYVMTDIAPSNINFWRSHPYLQKVIKDGLLDFAYYHHDEETKPLQLILSEKTLSPEELRNPLVVIGNYFFDTIPQDLFVVKEGKVMEGRITLSVLQSEKTCGIALTDPHIINHLQDTYDYVKIDDVDHYYPNFPEMGAVLKSYIDSLDNIPFLFPAGAFKSIRYFSKLSRGRLLLLAGDQGISTEEMLKQKKMPYISRHGSFSLPINYHAIARYFHLSGGMSLLTTYGDPVLVVSASALGGTLEEFPETHLAFRTHVDYFDSNDYYLLLEYTEKEWMTPTVDFIILLIKLGNWDPTNCYIFFERIRDEMPHTSSETKTKLADAIHRMWNHFYFVSPQEASFVMNLGVLFFDMERYQDAILFFQRALEIDKELAQAYENISLAYKALGDAALAAEYNLKAKELVDKKGILGDIIP